MSTLFRNHAFLSEILKHKDLPIFMTYEFSFYRCVNIEDWVYGKTISELHAGNLRSNDNKGRYSKLFPDEKISYWADSKDTALAEIKSHNGNNNYLTFRSYDDVSSTFPILGITEPLKIIDGRDLGFREILLKIENEENLTKDEKDIVKRIKEEDPDCLAYKSKAKKTGVNFLFFEKGFKKLALREVRLYLGERKSKNTKTVNCAIGSDYMPIPENYGKYFEPLVKLKMNDDYKKTKEYIEREMNFKNADILKR